MPGCHGAPPELRLWAKTDPFHPLLYHLVDTGNVAASLLENLPHTVRLFRDLASCPTDAGAVAWLSYLAALHDIGKCHAEFQGRGPEDILEPLHEAGLGCALSGLRFRHDALSGSWTLAHLMDKLGWSAPEARTVSLALRGHHGDFRSEDELPDPPGQPWEELRVRLESQVRSAFLGAAPLDWTPRFADHSTVGLLLVGLAVLSDWIASNEELFPRAATGPASLAAYAQESRKKAKAAVAGLGFDAPGAWPPGATFAEVWARAGIPEPRPIQALCQELCRAGLPPGLAIIEAPMGEGKTEAAIYLATQWLAAEDRKGIYLALPTAATSNQMYGRFRDFLETHDPRAARSARLVHGMAWLLDAAVPERAPEIASDQPDALDAPERAADWFRPRKRSLLAPYGVGTVDQALMGVLHVKHGFLRLFGLTEKVLLVDEVHAYDAYTTEILTLLLRWCGRLRIPAILLSATLPAARRNALVHAYQEGAVRAPSERAADPTSPGSGAEDRLGDRPYPLLTFVARGHPVRQETAPSSGRRVRLRIEPHPGTLGDPVACARLVVDRAVAGGCHAVIVNTVDSAQRVYCEVRAQLSALGQADGVPVMLFHGRFLPERRQEIEGVVLERFDKRSLLPAGHPEKTIRPERAILVATQVVEQSLDLDFDEMFTEVAPVDLIFQRAGRLHRHTRPTRPTGGTPVVHLFLPGEGRPEFGSSERVYHRFLLLKTLVSLHGRSWLEIPGDIRGLVDAVYDEKAELPEESSVAAASDLAEAWADLLAQRATDADLAKQYLIPPPAAEAFRLARVPVSPFDEHEGDASSYFAAKTRLGDQTQSVLLLDEGFGPDPPGGRPDRKTMLRLMARRVNLPIWWFRGVTPCEGFAPPERGPRWLFGVTVLRLNGGSWRGRDAKGVVWTIRDDKDLGVIRFEGKED